MSHGGRAGQRRDLRRLRNGAGGFTILDLALTLGVLATGLAVFMNSALAVKQSRQAAVEEQYTAAGLQRAVEVLKALGPTDAWEQYRPNDKGEPFPAHGSGPGTPFLIPVVNDAEDPSRPAQVEVRLFANETERRPEVGLPRDLDGDGAVSNPDVSLEDDEGRILARVLPVELSVRWRGADGGPRLATWQIVITRD